jgi:imidazole glycerol phosphate synthase subunit HisF
MMHDKKSKMAGWRWHDDKMASRWRCYAHGGQRQVNLHLLKAGWRMAKMAAGGGMMSKMKAGGGIKSKKAPSKMGMVKTSA